MNWRNEYIDHEDQVEGFLRRHLRAAGIPGPIDIRPDPQCRGFSRQVFTSDHKEILEFYALSNDRGEFTLRELKVGDGFRGHHLSSLLLKCLLGVAAGRDCSHILVTFVQEDGVSFWPYHAALPYSSRAEQYMNQERLTDFLERHALQMTDEVRRKIETALGHSTVTAWRFLSQSAAQLRNGSFLSRVIFKDMDWSETQVLLPSEPSTRAILTARLGALPPFRHCVEHDLSWLTHGLMKSCPRTASLGL